MTTPRSPQPDPLTRERALIDAAWGVIHSPSDWSRLRTLRTVLEERSSTPIPSPDTDLRARVEAVLAAWEREPVWTRPDVLVGIRAALSSSESTETLTLDAAWREAEEALAPDQRLTMWQDHHGPRYVQVLAPDKTVTDDDGEPVDDVMSPIISILADYPSKGLGKGAAVELRALTARLRPDEPPLTNTNGDEPQLTSSPDYAGPLPRDGRVVP